MCVCVAVDLVRPKRSLRSRCYGESESVTPDSKPSFIRKCLYHAEHSRPNHGNCISIRVHLARHRLPIFRFENQFTSDHQLPTEQFTPFLFRPKFQPKSLCCESIVFLFSAVLFSVLLCLQQVVSYYIYALLY